MKNNILITVSTYLFFLLFGFQSYAQAPSVVKWETSTKKVKKGIYDIHIEAKIDDGWSIYSMYMSDEGPIPTEIVFDDANIELVDATEEVGDKIEGFDELFGMNLIKYKKTVTFVQRVKAKKATVVTGVITFMSCDDEACLPPRDVEFEVKLK